MSYDLNEIKDLYEVADGAEETGHETSTSDDQEPVAEDLALTEMEELALTGLAEAFVLSEATKIIRLTRESQIANLTGRSALILARRAKDPLFDKYARFNGLRLQVKAQIQKKYASKAVQYGRKLYANAQRAQAQATAPATKK